MAVFKSIFWIAALYEERHREALANAPLLLDFILQLLMPVLHTDIHILFLVYTGTV